jgi:hypothetical protein
MPAACSTYSADGAVVALGAQDALLLAAHAGGSVSASTVGPTGIVTTLSSSRVSAARLTTLALAGAGLPVAFAGDAGGRMYALPVGAAELTTVAALHVLNGPVGALAAQQASGVARLAAGNGRCGDVALFDASRLTVASSDSTPALWSAHTSGGAGPGVRRLRWWPYSASNLLAAAGSRVVLLDTRAPPPPSSDLSATIGHAARLPALLPPTSAGPLYVTDLLLPPGGDPWTAYGGLEDGSVVSWDLRMCGVPTSSSGCSGDAAGKCGGFSNPVWALELAPEPPAFSAVAAASFGGVGRVLLSADDAGSVRMTAAR